MINKYFDGKLPNYQQSHTKPLDEELEKYANQQVREVEEAFDSVHLSNAFTEIWKLIARTNKYIDETTPWTLAKEERKEELGNVMYHLVENLRKVAILIKPAMSDTAEKIFMQLGIKQEAQTWDSLKNSTVLKDIQVTSKPEVLFARLETLPEIEFIKNAMQGK